MKTRIVPRKIITRKICPNLLLSLLPMKSVDAKMKAFVCI